MEYDLNEMLSSLASSDEAEVIEALKYLEKHGDTSCLSRIEPLQDHTSVSLRYYARRAGTAIQRRQGVVRRSQPRPESRSPRAETPLIPEPDFAALRSPYAPKTPPPPAPAPVAEPEPPAATTIDEEPLIDLDSLRIDPPDELPPARTQPLAPRLPADVEEKEEPAAGPAPPELPPPISPAPRCPTPEPPPPPTPTLSSEEIEDADAILLALQKNDEALVSEQLDRLLKLTTPVLDAMVVKELERYLLATDNTFLQSKLVKIIGRQGGIAYLDTLCRYLNSTDFRVIANTIEGLEFLEDPVVMRHVAPFLRHDDNRIKANAAKCIWNIDPEKGILVLRKMMGSTEFYYRDSGIYILGQIRAPEAFRLLLEAYAAETDPELLEKIRARLQEAHGRHPRPLLEDALAELDGEKAEFLAGLLETSALSVSSPPPSAPVLATAPPPPEPKSPRPTSTLPPPGPEEGVEAETATAEELDDLARELAEVKMEDEAFAIHLSLGEELTDAPPIATEPFEEPLDLSIDLTELSAPTVEGPAAEEPEIVLDLSLDDEADRQPEAPEPVQDKEDPRKKYARKRVIPNGEALLAALSRGDADSLAALGSAKAAEPRRSNVAVPQFDASRLKPIRQYLRNAQSPDEALRIEAIQGLIYYYKQGGCSEDEKDEAELYLGMAGSDASATIRDIVRSAEL